MRSHRVGAWVLTAFDSIKSDQRDYLKTEYDGLTFHIRPAHGDSANTIAVFVDDEADGVKAQLSINRFLSAMAWKDGEQYVTLSSSVSRASGDTKDNPRFNTGSGRVLRYKVIDSYDFEFLQNPPEQKQKLALALYREALNSSLLPLYQLLSFYKIINVGFRHPDDQMEWINDNLIKVRDMYSSFYLDGTDGRSRRIKQFIGRTDQMSERAALREHTRIMEDVNRKRGSVAPAIKGQTFSDITELWRTTVAPNLSPSTVRQHESYLRAHIMPRFKDSAPHSLDVATMQEFATQLRKKLSRKTVVNMLSAIFSILDYAGRCGTHVSKVSIKDLQLGGSSNERRGTFFTKDQASLIIQKSEEPYRTMFATAWATGLRAGELLALRVSDLDFDRHTIDIHRSADDATRQIRQTKTRNSTATLPMPSALEATLRNYLANNWKPNSLNLLFPNKRGTSSRLRDNVVRFGLKPILKDLGIADKEMGLHAFRHGLATELANSNTPLPALQAQMRHADVRTTLRIYAHVVQQSQRDAMEGAAISTSIGTMVPIGTEVNIQAACNQ